MMGVKRCVVALAAAVLSVAAPAAAQNLSLRAPAWATPLVTSDVIATTGGRAAIADEGVAFAVRVTIAPVDGGVARVIRYEARENAQVLVLRRFTGHRSTGWWMWGPDTPTVLATTPALRTEMDGLIRGAMGVAALNAGESSADGCHGEAAFVELTQGGRATSYSRACISGSDPVGRLALRLSEIAGSRTDQELAQAAVAEVLGVDRAFAAKAAADGVPAAFADYASEQAIMLRSAGENTSGHAAIVARFATWPAGARLEWTPRAGQVSSRGDMAWTWGDSVYVAADGARTPGRYVSIWTRDEQGRWRFSVDAGVD